MNRPEALGKRRAGRSAQSVWTQVGWAFRQPAAFSVLMLAALWLSVSLLALRDRHEVSLRVGDLVLQDIKARLAFDASVPLSPERVAARTPSVYVLDRSFLDRIEADLLEGFRLAAGAGSHADYVRQSAGRSFASLSEADWQAFHGAVTEDLKQAYMLESRDLRARLEAMSILGDSPPARVNLSGRVKLMTDEGVSAGREVALTEVTFASNPGLAPAGVGATGLEAQVVRFPEPSRGLVTAVLAGQLLREGRLRPIYVYSERLTEAEIQFRSSPEQIPQERVRIEANRVLASAGSRLTSAAADLLARENEAYLALLANPSPEKELAQLGASGRAKDQYYITGMLLLVLGVTAGLGLYIRAYEPDLLHRPQELAPLVGLVLLSVLLCEGLGLIHPMAAVVVSGTLSAGLAVAYATRFAFGVMLIVNLLAALCLGGSLALFLVLSTASAVMVFELTQIRQAFQFIRTGALCGVAAGTVAMAGGLAVPGLQHLPLDAGDLWQRDLQAGGWAAGCGLLSGFLGLGLLPIFERVFNTASNMTLLDWSRSDRELLQRLNIEAPGTEKHSQIVAMIAEAGVAAIGGNSLLARVGALYHDVGKTTRPLYFAENQADQFNPHDRLSPSMSKMTILAHVKDGLDLAQAYKLPRVLWPFIAEHHGTTVVEYFFHAARKNARNENEAEPEDSEYRYPGPRPKSKETAILLLCDGVEAAVRAMPEPSQPRIAGRVREILERRLKDGQFDDSNITLRELRLAETAIVRTLTSIYHGRVAFPKADKRSDGPDPSAVASAPAAPRSSEPASLTATSTEHAGPAAQPSGGNWPPSRGP